MPVAFRDDFKWVCVGYDKERTILRIELFLRTVGFVMKYFK